MGLFQALEGTGLQSTWVQFFYRRYYFHTLKLSAFCLNEIQAVLFPPKWKWARHVWAVKVRKTRPLNRMGATKLTLRGPFVAIERRKWNFVAHFHFWTSTQYFCGPLAATRRPIQLRHPLGKLIRPIVVRRPIPNFSSSKPFFLVVLWGLCLISVTFLIWSASYFS